MIGAIVLVVAFAAWRITSNGDSAPATTNPATVVGADGKESPVTPPPAPPGGPIAQVDDNLLIEVPAFNPLATISPFRSVLPKMGENTGTRIAPPPTNVGPLPLPGEPSKGGIIVEKDKPKFVLQGIMSGSGAPMAIIADGDKPPRIVWRGAILSDGSRVTRIGADRVFLAKGKSRAVLVLQPPQ